MMATYWYTGCPLVKKWRNVSNTHDDEVQNADRTLMAPKNLALVQPWTPVWFNGKVQSIQLAHPVFVRISWVSIPSLEVSTTLEGTSDRTHGRMPAVCLLVGLIVHRPSAVFVEPTHKKAEVRRHFTVTSSRDNLKGTLNTPIKWRDAGQNLSMGTHPFASIKRLSRPSVVQFGLRPKACN